jgi:hypothetical protein
MNIQNTQQTYKQPSLETMVGNQKQEYPKPSIPHENNLDDVISVPKSPKSEYNVKDKQLVDQLEKPQSNKEQAVKEVKIDETSSLDNMKTLTLQANTIQNKIDDHKASDIDSDTDKLSNTQNRMEAQKELQTIQEGIKQQQGFQTYAAEMGVA